MLKTLFRTLKDFNINVDKTFFSKIYESHPEYPALIAIADTLSVLNIKHDIVEIMDKSIMEVDEKVVAFIPIDGGRFDYFNKLKKDSHLYDAWEGVAFVFFNHKNHVNSIHEEYLKYTDTNRIANVILFFLAVLGFATLLFNTTEFIEGIYLLVNICGMVVSTLILYKEIGHKNKTIDSFCTNGETSDCEDVLSSKYSFIYKKLKWSDLIFAFFTSQLIWIIYCSIQGLPISNSIDFFSLLVCMSIPVVALSVYIQRFVLKT